MTLPAFSLPLVGPEGTGPIKSCTCIAYLEQDDLVFAGHSDGYISVCNFAQKRQRTAWVAHPNSQVIGLAVVPWKAASAYISVISQGRDGKIRFWSTQPAPFQKPLLDISCCQYTFCPFDVWTPGIDSQDECFLVYVGVDEEDASSVTLEVIRSSDNLIVSSIDANQISRLGMCMGLSGVPHNGKCCFLCGFEAGCVVLFVEGKQVARVSPLSSLDTRPITCVAIYTLDESTALVAVGKSAMDNVEERLPDFEMLILTFQGTSVVNFERCPKQPRNVECLGISSMTWRKDGRLLAACLWNGDIRCFFVSPQGRARCLGNLRSPGAVVGGGTLLGDWSSVSTSVSQQNPKEEYLSLSVRGGLFLPSKWLITTAPASAGGFGALNIWDVYRDS